MQAPDEVSPEPLVIEYARPVARVDAGENVRLRYRLVDDRDDLLVPGSCARRERQQQTATGETRARVNNFLYNCCCHRRRRRRCYPRRAQARAR